MPRDLHTLSFSEKRDWLRLIRTPNVGPVAFRDLLQRFGSADAALTALPQLSRKKAMGIPPLDQIEAEMEANDQIGVKLMAACEPDYPAYLRALDPPPPLISVLGRVDILHRPCAAIVGSRNASAIGQKFAHQMAHGLGEAGVTVISGLARGIDTSAHYGALSAGTAAVLGGGVDHIYPRQNTDLFHQLKEQGALISESPLGYTAKARDFPRRNRIISGLSLGVIVIEAAERSGTLITARYALEQNREVMAAPGSPLDPRTKGCNRLIRQGAALIENVDDVLNILEQLPRPDVMEPETLYVPQRKTVDVSQQDIASARTEILTVLSPTPTARDTLIRTTQLPVPLAIAALLELELSGDIHVEPDGRISLEF